MSETKVMMTTEEMQEQYEVLGFALGFCIVKRKSDGVRGTLDMLHHPRVYFDFEPERESL